MCRKFQKFKRFLKQYIGANSWFYNLYLKDYCTVMLGVIFKINFNMCRKF